MNKEEILFQLQQNTSNDGTSQFNFSNDMSVRASELKLLNELVEDCSIEKLSSALGYSIYRIL